MRLFALRFALVLGVGVLGAGVFAQTGWGDASVAPPSTFDTVPGLPDGRVYEQVSPENKHGSKAGENSILGTQVSFASADGNAVMFEGNGPMGDTPNSGSQAYIARRSAGVWRTRSATPPPLGEPVGFLAFKLADALPSLDLSHFAFYEGAGYVAESGGTTVYLAGPDPATDTVALGKPVISEPVLGGEAEVLLGGSSDLSAVYFESASVLTAQEAPRLPNIQTARGLYEWTSGGGLVSADILPDGSTNPWGAVPAGNPYVGISFHEAKPGYADIVNHQVSADGSRFFFVTPDPRACPEGSCGEKPELYVRETLADGMRRTTLVSKVFPGVSGSPGQAPDGVVAVLSARCPDNSPDSSVQACPRHEAYAAASADGSHVFFESLDRLTSEAPADGFLKMYDFDTVTSGLRYLPGVTDGMGGAAAVIAVSGDGSSFVFASREGGPDGPVVGLDRWADGPGGGTVSRIAGLQTVAWAQFPSERASPVLAGRLTEDGSVFVFETASPVPGFNNADGVFEVYRYDVPGNALSCVSCPPAGAVPASDAVLSHFETPLGETSNTPHGAPQFPALTVNRGMSSDGSRVFFESPEALVPQDGNGVSDVYEWEGGVVHLISSGAGGESWMVDNSASGDDVFFATANDLVAGDTDGSSDVYDARVPRPGDTPVPPVLPCQGEACQGPAGASAALGVPGSAVFTGAGSIALPTASAVAHKPVKKKPKPKRKATHRRRTHGHAQRRSSDGLSISKAKGKG